MAAARIWGWLHERRRRNRLQLVRSQGGIVAWPHKSTVQEVAEGTGPAPRRRVRAPARRHGQGERAGRDARADARAKASQDVRTPMRCRFRSRSLHILFVELKMMIRAPGPSLWIISRRRSSFWRMSRTTCTTCVMSLLAFRVLLSPVQQTTERLWGKSTRGAAGEPTGSNRQSMPAGSTAWHMERTDVEDAWVLQELAGKTTDFLWPRRGKHQGLSLERAIVQNLADLWLEPHTVWCKERARRHI